MTPPPSIPAPPLLAWFPGLLAGGLPGSSRCLHPPPGGALGRAEQPPGGREVAPSRQRGSRPRRGSPSSGKADPGAPRQRAASRPATWNCPGAACPLRHETGRYQGSFFPAATHPLPAEWPPQGCHRHHPARDALAACAVLLSVFSGLPPAGVSPIPLPAQRQKEAGGRTPGSLRAPVALVSALDSVLPASQVQARRAVPEAREGLAVRNREPAHKSGWGLSRMPELGGQEERVEWGVQGHRSGGLSLCLEAARSQSHCSKPARPGGAAAWPSTLVFGHHPNRFSILSWANLTAGEEAPITPAVGHP